MLQVINCVINLIACQNLAILSGLFLHCMILRAQRFSMSRIYSYWIGSLLISQPFGFKSHKCYRMGYSENYVVGIFVYFMVAQRPLLYLQNSTQDQIYFVERSCICSFYSRKMLLMSTNCNGMEHA